MIDKENKLLMKIATGDKSITILGDIAKFNKKAADPLAWTNLPTAEDTLVNKLNDNAVKTVTNKKPSYIDVLKNRAGDAWNWTKGKWNELSPETQKFVGDVGLGTAGGLAGDALVRLLGGKRNKALRLLGMLGGVGVGMAANSYLQNPDFKNKVNTGFNSLINKFKS